MLSMHMADLIIIILRIENKMKEEKKKKDIFLQKNQEKIGWLRKL